MPEMKLASLELSPSGLPAWFDLATGASILQYGQRLAARELLVNTLGNIVVRTHCPYWKREVMYTKHLGLSLEESGLEHLAVLDMQSDDVIAFFSVMQWRQMRYVSNDTALVMGKPPCILGEGVNVELDVSAIGRCADDTNCIVMPGHGITSFGRDLSEAYHRAVAFVAEIRRLIICQHLSAATGKSIAFASEEEVQHMYELGEQVIYGSTHT